MKLYNTPVRDAGSVLPFGAKLTLHAKKRLAAATEKLLDALG